MKTVSSDNSLGKLPNSSGCFVCGSHNPHGLRLRFHVDGDRVATSFTLADSQMGYRGIAHGGIISAVLDEAMGWAAAVRHGRFCVTIEMTVRFVKPTPVGTNLTAWGWTADNGRRIWTTESELRGTDDVLYARAAGRYMPLSAAQTREIAGYLNFDEGCIPADRLVRQAP